MDLWKRGKMARKVKLISEWCQLKRIGMHVCLWYTISVNKIMRTPRGIAQRRDISRGGKNADFKTWSHLTRLWHSKIFLKTSLNFILNVTTHNNDSLHCHMIKYFTENGRVFSEIGYYTTTSGLSRPICNMVHVKMFLCLTKYHAMKKCPLLNLSTTPWRYEMNVERHVFLTSTYDWDERSTSRPNHFNLVLIGQEVGMDRLVVSSLDCRTRS